MSTIRICRKCGTEFEPPRCKACQKIQQTNYRKKNKEKIYAVVNQWHIDHPELVAAYKKKYYSKNKEKVIAAAEKRRKENPEREKNRLRESRIKNPEHYRDRNRAWKQKNPDKVKASGSRYYAKHSAQFRIQLQNRRARKRQNGGKLSKGLSDKLFELQRGKCACCAKSLKEGYHLDHRMPIALGGAHEDGNMQLLCPFCNLSKHAKHPVDFMQSRGFLL